MRENNIKNKAEQKNRSIGRKIGFFCSTLLSILLLLGLFAVSAFAYTYYHIDYEQDERLFEMAHGSHTTRMFYNGYAADGVREGGLLNSTHTGEKGERIRGLPVAYHPVEKKEARLVGTQNMIFCPYADIPEDLKNAFVAIEDHRFFTHNGVDWFRTAGAVANYFLGFDDRFGASTITQQLIKNISSDNEVSATRKIREMCRAMHLEMHHSKEEILELYLNIVPLSEGCVGVGAAAEVYFGKKPSELTLSECASIAAVTNLPRYYDPVCEPANNDARRRLILSEMLRYGMVSEEEYQKAVSEQVTARGAEDKGDSVMDWYTETVISDVADDLCSQYGYSRELALQMIFNGGLSIYTLEDREIQVCLEEYFASTGNFPEAVAGGLSYAMTVVDPKTGDLLGVVGGVGEKKENRVLNYATAVKRAPGSSLKPLSVYAPALEEGLITWGSVFDDVPVRFYEKSGGGYTAWPQNLPTVYGGLTDVATAVRLSKNTVAVRVFERLGAECSYRYLTERLGLTDLVRSGKGDAGNTVTDLAPAPLALGQLSEGVSVRAMTNAYGALADGGMYHKGRSYALVLDGQGRVLLENKPSASRAFRPAVASVMTQLLRGVTEEGTAKALTLPRMIETAGKTGTSGNGQDKWFVGYTPYLVAGIWCGYPDGKTAVPPKAQDAHLAVWDAVMKRLHSRYVEEGGNRTFPLDRHVKAAAYCADSGCLSSDACRRDARGARIRIGYFERGTEPHESCQTHILVPYDTERGGVVSHMDGRSYEKVGMILAEGRDFPAEVYVEDAQYVYRRIGESDPLPTGQGEPFFSAVIPRGHFVGISRTKDGRQFNAAAEAVPSYGDSDFRRFLEKYFPRLLHR